MHDRSSAEVDTGLASEVARAALRNLGLAPVEADLTATSLMVAEQAGRSSHGLIRIPGFIEPRIRAGQLRPRTEPRLVYVGERVLVLDGMGGIGYYGAKVALEAAMSEGEEYGVGTAVIS